MKWQFKDSKYNEDTRLQTLQRVDALISVMLILSRVKAKTWWGSCLTSAYCIDQEDQEKCKNILITCSIKLFYRAFKNESSSSATSLIWQQGAASLCLVQQFWCKSDDDVKVFMHCTLLWCGKSACNIFCMKMVLTVSGAIYPFVLCFILFPKIE